MICTTGTWVVKEGREEEFARRWQEGVNATVLETPGVTFKLFRDRDNPRRYFSLDEGWRSIEQIDAIKESPAFQDSIASIWRVLDSGEASTLELVAEIS